MAPKSSAASLIMFILAVVMLSTAAESRNVMPELADECFTAIFKFPSCLFEIIGAGQGGGSGQVSAPCCNVFNTLTQNCQFQISGNLIPVIQKSCGSAVGGPSDGGVPPPPAPPAPVFGPAVPPV